MIDTLTIRNFQSFAGEHRFPLGPLTLIYGQNASGKSAVLRSLLFLAQNAGAKRTAPEARLSFAGPRVDLGSYLNAINGHDPTSTLGIEATGRLGTEDWRWAVRLATPEQHPSGIVETLEIGEACFRRVGEPKGANELVYALGSDSQELSLEDSLRLAVEDLRRAIAETEALVAAEQSQSNDAGKRISLEHSLRNLQERLYSQEEELLRTLSSAVKDENHSDRLLLESSIAKLRTEVADAERRIAIRERTLAAHEVLRAGMASILQMCLELADSLEALLRKDVWNWSVHGPFSVTRRSDGLKTAYRDQRDELRAQVAVIGAEIDRRRAAGADLREEDSLIELPSLTLAVKQVSQGLLREQQQRGALVDRLKQVGNLFAELVHVGPARSLSPRVVSNQSDDLMAILLREPSLLKETANWFRKLGIPYTPAVRVLDNPATPYAGSLVALELIDQRTKVAVSSTDVGYGVSQVLPVITSCTAATGGTVLIEQPEVHVHPRLQAELAELFADAIRRGVQVIVETHSEALLLRLQKLVRSNALAPDQVQILFVGNDEEVGAWVQPIGLDSRGRFTDEWPGGFFEERLKEWT